MTKTNAFPSPRLPLLDFNTFFHLVLAGETGELDTRRTQRESKAPPLLAAAVAAAAVTSIFWRRIQYERRRPRFSVRQQHFDCPRETNQICYLLARP